MYSLARQLSFEKNMNRQVISNSKRSTVKRNTAASTYQYDKSHTPVGSAARGQNNTSHSEPDLARQLSMPKRSVPPQRFLSNRGTYKAERAISQYITNTTAAQHQFMSTTTGQPQYTMNGTSQIKTNNQFICSQIDAPKQLSKLQVTEDTTKNKADSG